MYIGLNNTTVEQLDEAWATGVRFHTLQIRYSMFSWRYAEKYILPWCAEHNVGILAHSVLGKGLLGGRHEPGHQWAPDDERSNMVDFHGEKFARFCAAVTQLKVVAARHGATMPELAVGWVLRRPEISVALVGGTPFPPSFAPSSRSSTTQEAPATHDDTNGCPRRCRQVTRAGRDEPAVRDRLDRD